MEEVDKLLLALFEKKKMTFREIFPVHIPNPNRAQTILTELIKKKLIQQEIKNWRPGQKKSYCLTEKGELHCQQLDINNINESLKRLQSMSSALRSNSSGIKEAINNQRMGIFLKNFNGKESTPELHSEFFNKMRAPDVPLLDIFRNMHEIIRQEFGINDGFNKKLSAMATVIKDGTLYLARPEDLDNDKLILFPI